MGQKRLFLAQFFLFFFFLFFRNIFVTKFSPCCLISFLYKYKTCGSIHVVFYWVIFYFRRIFIVCIQLCDFSSLSFTFWSLVYLHNPDTAARAQCPFEIRYDCITPIPPSLYGSAVCSTVLYKGYSTIVLVGCILKFTLQCLIQCVVQCAA